MSAPNDSSGPPTDSSGRSQPVPPPTANGTKTTGGGQTTRTQQATGAQTQQQNLQFLQQLLSSPSARYLLPEVTALMKKINSIEQHFGQKEEKLKQGFEALEKNTKEEERRIAEERKREELRMTWERQTHEDRIRWEKENLQREKKEFEKMKERSTATFIRQDMVTVDVGGEKFKTELRTLARYPDSLFPEVVRVAEEHRPPNKPRCDYIFIDRDGKHFRLVLNFLRQGEEVLRGTYLRNADQHLLHEILCEAKYYKLSALELLVQRQMITLERPQNFSQLKDSGYFAPIRGGSGIKYVTTQDILLKQKNLTGVIFEQVHFKHGTSFEGSILTKAVFRRCVFEAAINFSHADLYKATFDHCDGIQLSTLILLHNTNTEEVTFNPPLEEEED